MALKEISESRGYYYMHSTIQEPTSSLLHLWLN